MSTLRTMLVLGRVSNLPTVWSNCLAGWFLGGTGNAEKLPLLLAGATLLYLGGMFLNDAFDAQFDAEYRRERPIPSGAVAAKDVWMMGGVLLAGGAACLYMVSLFTGILGMMLLLCIVIYDAVHKLLPFSPVLMAGCRFFLYLVAASTAGMVTGWSIWCGLALGLYIVGLSFLAAKESTRATLDYWPCALLAAPIVLALLMNTAEFRQTALLLSLALVLWIARHLRYAFGRSDRNVGRAVSGLLAGIALVDLLAVADVVRPFGLAFIGLFLLALVMQRYVPAT